MFVVRLGISSSIPDYSKHWVEGTERRLLPRVGPQLGAVFNIPHSIPRASRDRAAQETHSHFLAAFESSGTEPAKEDVPGIQSVKAITQPISWFFVPLDVWR